MALKNILIRFIVKVVCILGLFRVGDLFSVFLGVIQGESLIQCSNSEYGFSWVLEFSRTESILD